MSSHACPLSRERARVGVMPTACVKHAWSDRPHYDDENESIVRLFVRQGCDRCKLVRFIRPATLADPRKMARVERSVAPAIARFIAMRSLPPQVDAIRESSPAD